MRGGLPLLLLLLLLLASASSKSQPYQGNDATMIVHLVPHTVTPHGWQQAFEANAPLVNDVLTSVLSALSADPTRRFVWSELAYFQRWWRAQSQKTRDRTIQVIEAGQLEFVGGTWAAQDEAISRAESRLEGLTLGHTWLLDHLGVRPRVGWQVGAYGHSSATPKLLLLAGFEALVINRVHHQLKSQLKSSQGMEFMWEGLWTHILDQHYSAPEGFDFESKGVRQVTNPRRRAERLVKQLRERAPHYRTHHLLVPFGDDFRFQHAERQFTNMDKLMSYINEKVPGVKVRYSTASEYVDAVHNAASVTSLRFPSRTGDFLPFADNADSYWTGFYSTRPTLKAAVRGLEARVRSASALFALARARVGTLGPASGVGSVDRGRLLPVETEDPAAEWAAVYPALRRARVQAALVANAITGTARSDVVDDFLARAARATAAADRVAGASLEQLLSERGMRPTLTHEPFELVAPVGGGAQGTDAPSSHPVVFHNMHGRTRVELARIRLRAPWSVARHARVVDARGRPVVAQVHQTVASQREDAGSGSRRDAGSGGGGAHSTAVVLTFLVEVPPLGISTYFVSISSARQRVQQARGGAGTATPLARVYEIREGRIVPASQVERASRFGGGLQRGSGGRVGGGGGGAADSEDGLLRMDQMPGAILLDNQLLSVELDHASGLIRALTDKRSRRRTAVYQRYLEYTSRRSGAYLFRPASEHDHT